MNQPWIPADRIAATVQYEPALVIFGLAIASWLAYKVLLRDLSPQRHANLKRHFFNLFLHSTFALALALFYWALQYLPNPSASVTRMSPYVGLAALLSGATVFVKTSRILIFEYLFLGHMKEGVPLLLINIFTLLLSLVMGGWIATDIFGVRLAPLLATSAMLSLVLGLALQDTLGHLFAGIALQFDKPYEIGDWIEIQSGSQKWAGQVTEISWRSTVLLGLCDEIQTVPNRVMAAAEISNFSTKVRPIIRSQVFKLPHETEIDAAKKILWEAATSVASIRREPGPRVLISEVTESWISFKLVYFIDDYGSQLLVADQVMTAVLLGLEDAGLHPANDRMQVFQMTAKIPPPPASA